MPEDTEQDALLRHAISQYETEVRSWREQRVREWRRNHLYWEGQSHLWWSAVHDDYRYPAIATLGEVEQFDLDEDDNRTINVYEAHGRSIVAALSSQIPDVRFYPQDAENYKDLITAQTYSKISDILSKENNFPLLFAKALYILFNEDYVCAHVYNESKYEYGTQYEENLDDNGELDSYTEQPKSKTKIDIYGALHVTIPPYVRKQSGIPYLILRSEISRAEAVELYGTDEEMIEKIMGSSRSGEDDDEFMRSFNDLNDNDETVIVREVWLRPWALFILGVDHLQEVQQFRSQFPEGIKVTFVNDELVELDEQDMDKHWEIASDPLSEYLIGRPLGANLVPIQEMTDDLVDLTMQTIAHGIPVEFADPRVINIDAMKDRDNAPGMLYPAKAPIGKNLSESFHSSDKATLSREVAAFTEYINYSGQFVSGDFPSVHGGSLEGGSRTLGEYSQSRQNALQRLSVIYNSTGDWNAQIKLKAVQLYVSSLRDDELIGTEYRDGAFMNIWIRLQDVTGQIGRAEPVSSDVFPNTPALIREMYMALIQLKNPMIDQLLADPNNLPVLAKSLGLNDLYIPGEDDRAKQWGEIQQLINTEPVLEGQPLPSVQVQTEVDNHEVEAHICLTFLKSPEGQMLKQTNPNGYLNVLLHYMQHKQIAEMMQMPEPPPDENTSPQGGNSGPRDRSQSA